MVNTVHGTGTPALPAMLYFPSYHTHTNAEAESEAYSFLNVFLLFSYKWKSSSFLFLLFRDPNGSHAPVIDIVY